MPYRFMSLKSVKKYEAEARRRGVSKVARSPRGFLTAYKRARTSRNLSDSWKRKRINFIKRHLVQYRKKPTRRRELALIMWAFKPLP